MTFNSSFFRRLTLTSYLLLIVWLVVWHFVLTIDKPTSTLFTILFWIVPILLPAKGLFEGKPYTYAWTNFIVMYYLLHGLTAVYAVEGERWYALVEILLCSVLFTGCSFYARIRGRELGLGIRKLKEELLEEKHAFESLKTKDQK
ncbi:DUF2069 domain-containing protein [uncultured Paraglaciecola sp.]|jgi:uncharacterized membrane protein|uniref:DUF2069 domain-containing protein n=1 Tax=uncultured Paraglaciecola sp. TaxID=1765024 RepID=UPI0025DDF19D|nr:DUF2069 domain-containing protein [uncultured Paraglaciecola sp.]